MQSARGVTEQPTNQFPVLSYTVGPQRPAGRWTSELHYITTGEVIRQCSEVWWTAAMSLFFSPCVRKLPLPACEGDSPMSRKCLRKPKSVWDGLGKQSRGLQSACVCVCPSLMIYCDKWSAINKQQAIHPPVHTNKQTNKQRRRTNRPSGRVMAEFKVINQSSTGRDERVQPWTMKSAELFARSSLPSTPACVSWVCEHVFLAWIYEYVLFCQSARRECAYFTESKCVGCNLSQSGTTQQPVQRPVCIITACAAAQYRQTRLWSSELQNTDLPPHCRNPCGPAQPSIVAQKWTNKCLLRQTARHEGKFAGTQWGRNANSDRH